MVFFSVLIRKCDSRSETNLPSNNPMAAEKIALLVEHVHGSAFPLACSRHSSVQFRHHVLGVCAQYQRVSVVAVCSHHAVGGTNGFRDAR